MFGHKTLRLFLIAVFCVLTAGFSFSANAETSPEEEPDQYVFLRLVADQTQVSGGETIRLGLEHIIHPKWHTYWKNPGDSGTPTQIDWDLPKGFSVSEPEWPTPIKIPYGPLTNYGYEEQVTLLQNLTLPDDVGDAPFMLKASVNLLVCHEICIPESHDVSIIFNGNTPAELDSIAAAEAALPVDVDWKANYSADENNFNIKVIKENVSEFAGAKNVILAPENWGAIDNNADAQIEILNSGFQISQKLGERNLEEIDNLPVVIFFDTAAGEKKSYRLIAKPSAPPAPLPVVSSPSMTVLHALLFALIGGLILNLMPCVFPVLSMKALSLINLQEKEEKKARGYGLSYTAGILISFGLIGGTLLALKAGGAQIGWGFQLQSPAVIIFLAYLVFIIGLNLSGFFEFTGKLSGIGRNLAQKSGHSGAFFTGVLATLVATPCTAPFMGAAMGFALTQPAAISMLVFLMLGFGLALPYLALCFIPALRAKLPKPGLWMETFRQLLAFPMFITAAWLIWVLSQQVADLSVFCALLGLVAIAFSLWLIRVMPKEGIAKIITTIALIGSLFFIVSSFITPTQEIQTGETQNNNQNWETYEPALLSHSLAESDEPIFINMTAAWCITCKVNEKVALSTDSTKELFENNDVIYLKGDWTNQDSDITEYLHSFGRNGVPLYVYYGPRNIDGNRPEPKVLPQILTSGVIEDLF